MVVRSIALFFGAFGLLNDLLGRIVPGFDANLWWIDFRLIEIVSPTLASTALYFTSAGLLLFAARGGRAHDPTGRAMRAALWTLCALVIQNIVQYYALLASGMIRSAFPVPLSLFLLLPVLAMLRACSRSPGLLILPGRAGGRAMDALRVLTTLGVAGALFPVAQMICFGSTDYRRPADVAVVFGARAYASGRMSTALFDRTRTGVELYRSGLVGRLFFSGGPGDGAIHEVEAMRNYALEHGVDSRDIILDPSGLSTQATVENSMGVFQRVGYSRVLAVSQFYHLPRIKLTYLRAGLDVYTVPAAKSRLILKLPVLMAREIAAFWFYYLRPLLPQI
ncbi:MAG: YdcF family protein [Leptospirales bacterium]|jgi:vancomycin permeability regulator SanA